MTEKLTIPYKQLLKGSLSSAVRFMARGQVDTDVYGLSAFERGRLESTFFSLRLTRYVEAVCEWLHLKKNKLPGALREALITLSLKHGSRSTSNVEKGKERFEELANILEVYDK